MRGEAPYQFTALEFTEPGAWVFFGPRGDSGLNIRREAERERETEQRGYFSCPARCPSCRHVFSPLAREGFL